MGLPATTQDIVHGIDFTGAATGTAAEHNQLVDLSAPYTDGADAAQGIGLIITTTDTALNTPSVPDPTAVGYSKWKRYVWNRRPHASAASQIPSAYMWIDAVTSDATYKKWILLDPATYTTVVGATGTGTPLQNALNYLNTQVTNANAAAAAAQSSANFSIAQYAGLAGTVSAQGAALLTTETGLSNTNVVISGDGSDPTAAGGINGQLATLQANLTAALAQVKSVSSLTPAAIIGSMIRTNSTASVTEWFDPSQEYFYISATGAQNFNKNATTLITLDQAISIPAGAYHVHGHFFSQCAAFTGSPFMLGINILLAGVSAISFIPFPLDSGRNVCAALNGILVIPKASGTQVVTANVVTPNVTATNPLLTTFASNIFMTVVFRRLHLPQT